MSGISACDPALPRCHPLQELSAQDLRQRGVEACWAVLGHRDGFQVGHRAWWCWRWHLVPSSSSRDAPHRARRPRRSRVRASAVHRTCAHGFKATALTDNERERGQSGHASQHGVPSGEAQFRLPAHRVRSITCPHAPSTCGRLAVNAEIELESAIADSASFAKASGRTSR